MAGPPAPLPPRALQPPAARALLRHRAGGLLVDATSPTPSAEPPGASPCPPRGRRAGGGGQQGSGGVGASGGPRQSASEREKLRMRRLAQALRRLRHYLPPAMVPPGQSLTKIETLRLAIRYIAHLSALLGLSREALARRRGAAPRHCPLCPQGLGCCQTPNPRPLADTSPPGAVGWGSPPPMVGTPPELHGAAGTGRGAWGSPHCGFVAGTPPEVLGAPDMGLEAWGSPPCIPVRGTPPELHGTPASSSGPWSSLPCSLGAVTPLEPPLRCSAGTGMTSSCCLEPAAPPQTPGAGLTDTGPPETPTRGSQLPAHHQLGSPPDLDRLVSPAPHAAPILPGCTPARHWGGWS